MGKSSEGGRGKVVHLPAAGRLRVIKPRPIAASPRSGCAAPPPESADRETIERALRTFCEAAAAADDVARRHVAVMLGLYLENPRDNRGQIGAAVERLLARRSAPVAPQSSAKEPAATAMVLPLRRRLRSVAPVRASEVEHA